MSLAKQFAALVRATLREGRAHPALWAAILMRPMGFHWRDHRWVEKGEA